MRARRAPADRPVGFDGHSPAPLVEDDFSEDQIEQYLAALREGAGLQLSARAIGSTQTRMRRYCTRDPVFAGRVQEALDEGVDMYRDRLRAAARVIALRTAPGEVVPRILEVELATHVPGYEHLRRDRTVVSGQVQHEHSVTLDLDPAKLDALPLDELREIRERLVRLNAAHPDVDAQRALPQAD